MEKKRIQNLRTRRFGHKRIRAKTKIESEIKYSPDQNARVTFCKSSQSSSLNASVTREPSNSPKHSSYCDCCDCGTYCFWRVLPAKPTTATKPIEAKNIYIIASIYSHKRVENIQCMLSVKMREQSVE